MKTCLVAAAAAIVIGLGATTANAAMIVYDPTSYAKLIEQARTALDQLNELKAQVQQGEQLLTSLNDASVVSRIASELNIPGLRDFLPDVAALSAAANGDLDALGAIGRRADEIRAANRLYTPTDGDEAGADLEAAGQRAARDLALGEVVSTAGADRLEGLKTLQAAIDTAPTARAVLDLQARAANRTGDDRQRSDEAPGPRHGAGGGRSSPGAARAGAHGRRSGRAHGRSIGRVSRDGPILFRLARALHRGLHCRTTQLPSSSRIIPRKPYRLPRSAPPAPRAGTSASTPRPGSPPWNARRA